MADSTSTQKFPAPYVESVRENDPVVIRVNQDMGEIGSRASGLPKDVKAMGMTLSHVGSVAGGSRSGNSDNK